MISTALIFVITGLFAMFIGGGVASIHGFAIGEPLNMSIWDTVLFQLNLVRNIVAI